MLRHARSIRFRIPKSGIYASFLSSNDDDDDNKSDKKSDQHKQKLKIRKVDGHGKHRTNIENDTHHEQHEKEQNENADKKREKNIRANEKAIFATKVGAVANVGLAASKCILGVSVASTALVADGISSLGDLLCDGVVYYTVTEARKKATPDRPWGLGKIEPLGALSVGGLLLLTGVGIGASAINAALDMAQIAIPSFNFETLELIVKNPAVTEVLTHPQHMDVVQSEMLSGNQVAALAVSGMSIFAKEALFRYTLKVGERANSAAVVANAWQHRADVSTSSAVFIGLVGSMMGYPLLDPLAGILVAGVIVRQAFTIGSDSLKDLSDAPASAKETDTLRQTCLDVNGILSVEDIRARKSGPFLYVEVTVGVDGSISASAAHRLAMMTKMALLRHHEGRVSNAAVHVEPLGATGLGEKSPAWARDHIYIVDEIKKAVLEVQSILSVSEVQVYYRDSGLIAAKVDIVLPATLTISEAHVIAVDARRSIIKALPGISDVDVDLELDETV